MALSRPFPVDYAYPNAVDLRREFGGLLPREGIFATPDIVNQGVAQPGSGWSVHARPFVACARRGLLDFAPGYGSVLIANDSLVTGAWTLPDAPATGSRYSVLWARASDSTQGEPLVTPDGETIPRAVPVFGITNGAAASTPTLPAIPSGAVAVGAVRIYSTNASAADATFVQMPSRLILPAGQLAVRLESELPAIATPWERALNVVDGTEYAFRPGTGWVVNRVPRRSFTPVIVNLSSSAYTAQGFFEVSGGVCFGQVQIALTAVTTPTQTLRFQEPYGSALRAEVQGQPLGEVTIRDMSSSTYYTGRLHLGARPFLDFYRFANASPGVLVPLAGMPSSDGAYAAGDVIYADFSYLLAGV